jgi:hypothetical protein
MPRPIEHRAGSTYPAAQVYAAFTDEAFLRERLAELGGKKSELTSFSTEGDTTRYTLRQTVDAADLPSVARKVVRGDLVIERTEAWSASGERYAGDIQAHVPGTPASVHGTMLLTDTADGSELVLGGSVKVGVPLIGGKLEDMIVDQLGRLLRAEAKFTQRWLESHDTAS